MNHRSRSILTQGGIFAVAALLLYFALRDVDFAAVSTAIRDANYVWLLPLVVIGLLSHWLRAWRWTLLIDALPDEERPRKPVSTADAFGALMIGYMVNYVAPRLGEVARTANLSGRRKAHFSSIFGTVVVERILDVAVLGFGILSVIVLMRDQMADLYLLLVEPLRDEGGIILLLAIASALVAASVGLFFLFRFYLRRNHRAAAFWTGRLRPLAVSFRSGLLTIVRSKRRIGLVTSTIAIWFCYALMAFIPFVMLNMSGPYGLDLMDGWAIMILGSIGVAIPTPGGTGTYHYITILVLTALYSVDRAPAATYAILVHAVQLVLYVVVGVLCLVVQGQKLRGLTREASSAQEAGVGVEGSDR